MTNKFNKIAFLFPGQGAQYVGMGKLFFEMFSTVKEIYDYSDHLLHQNISKIIFEGPDHELIQTKNSQLGIFITSMAILSVLKKEFPSLKESYCSGLSLGEYSALCASEHLSFENTLQLVNLRAQFMNEACEKRKGAMAVILGMSSEEVVDVVKEANAPQDLWIANFNCPGQIVISGTEKGIEIGIEIAKRNGAKRILPLSVHGAFHSGLMKEAEEKLAPYIQDANIIKGSSSIIMNVTGAVTEDIYKIKENLIRQVSQSVLWEQSIQKMLDVELFIEMGPGSTLAGFNKRIGVQGKTLSIETPKDLETLYNLLG